MVLAGALIALLAAAEPPPPAEGRWYGYQALLVDGAALGIGAVSFALRNEPHAGNAGSLTLTLAYIAAGVFLAGAPVVHAAHGNPDEAARSWVRRIGFPAAGFVVSLALYSFAWKGCTACAYAIVPVGAAALAAPIAFDATAHGPVLRF